VIAVETGDPVTCAEAARGALSASRLFTIGGRGQPGATEASGSGRGPGEPILPARANLMRLVPVSWPVGLPTTTVYLALGQQVRQMRDSHGRERLSGYRGVLMA
jgi:hypothetical protein